jgi:hypothetical protein
MVVVVVVGVVVVTYRDSLCQSMVHLVVGMAELSQLVVMLNQTQVAAVVVEHSHLLSLQVITVVVVVQVL